MSNRYDYGFIGTGIIGNLLVQSFIESEITIPKNIIASDINSERLDQLISQTNIESGTNNEVIKNSDNVYLCVRPQDLPSIYAELRENIEKKILVSSVAAIESASYYNNLGKINLVRIIPSITIKDKGTILIVGPENQISKKVASDLFKISNIHYVPEAQIDEYTHLASCSPAIISQFVKQYLDSIINRGIDPNQGKKIIFDTVQQVANLLKKYDFKIIDEVCTPGGISQVGVEYISSNYNLDSLTKELLNRMKRVKKEWGGLYEQ